MKKIKLLDDPGSHCRMEEIIHNVSIIKSDFNQTNQEVIKRIISILWDKLFGSSGVVEDRNILKEFSVRAKTIMDKTFGGDFDVKIIGANSSYALKFRKGSLFCCRLPNKMLLVMNQTPLFELMHPDQVLCPDYTEDLTTESRAIRSKRDAKIVSMFPESTLEEAIEGSFVEASISDKAVEVILQVYNKACENAKSYKGDAISHPLDCKNLATQIRNHLTKSAEPIWHVLVGPDVFAAPPVNHTAHARLLFPNHKYPSSTIFKPSSSVGPFEIFVYKDAQCAPSSFWQQVELLTPYVCMVLICLILLLKSIMCGSQFDLNHAFLQNQVDQTSNNLTSPESTSAISNLIRFEQSMAHRFICPCVKSEWTLIILTAIIAASLAWKFFFEKNMELEDKVAAKVDAINPIQHTCTTTELDQKSF